jgi:tetratricopeptide (TPR) repeat protein
MARQLSLSGAQDQFRSDPTPETAVAVHAQMLGFHAHDDAKALRDEALAKFPDDAMLCAALASQLDEIGEFDLATTLYERAHQLDSSLPHARDGMALRKIVDGKLDEARQLLDFLERPGAGQLYPLSRLEHLAGAYQKRGRHQETLTLAAHLIRELPAIAEHRQFRKFVEKSEKVVRPADSILPKRKMSWRGLFDTQSTAYSSGQRWAAFLSIAAVLVVVTMLLLNEYRREHRTVYVRNEFGPSTSVVVDGNIEVPPGRQTELVLGEGKHHVVVSGAIDEEYDMDVSTTYWQRWTYSPAWIINVGGAAQLLVEKLYYAERPRPSEPTLAAGENLLYVPHVDYLFVSPPQTLDVGSKGGEVVKQRLSIANESPKDVFYHLLNKGAPGAGLHYAESRLLIDPANDDLLKEYVNAAAGASHTERAKQFLKRHFDTRPVLISWHRLFHELHTSAAEKSELIERYDALLVEQPNNAALLYLRGRLTPKKSVAREFYNRAIGADPQLSYPWMALGHQACTSGDWPKCKEYMQQALDCKADDSLQSTIQLARLALGEGDAMERECREQIASSEPDDALPIVVRLSTVLVDRGDAEGAKQAISDWEARIPSAGNVQTALEAYRGMLELMSGDLQAVERRVTSGTANPELRLGWLLAVGQPKQAAGDSTLAPQLESPWNALALSLAFDLTGMPSEAQLWRNQAADALAQLDFDEIAVAELLRSDQPPTEEQLAEIGILPNEKSLLLAVLAMRFPAQHDELAVIAKHFDVQPSPYRPLVRKAIAQQP